MSADLALTDAPLRTYRRRRRSTRHRSSASRRQARFAGVLDLPTTRFRSELVAVAAVLLGGWSALIASVVSFA